MTTTLKNLPAREQREELSKKARAFYEPLREQLEKEHWKRRTQFSASNLNIQIH
jgi:hypothetical protein